MRRSATVATVAGVSVGVLSALQSRANGELSHQLGNGLEAALWSFGSGLVLLLAIAASRPAVRQGLHRVRAAVRASELPWWYVPAGMLGGFFVAAQSITVPTIGVAVFMVAVVAGQSGNSLIVDRIGLGPAGRQAISTRRVTSAFLAILAVGVAVANRLATGELSAGAVFLALLAGIGIAIQQALNGRIGIAAGNPMSATVLNFFFGSVVLLVALVVAVGMAGWPLAALFAAPWWAYLGGVIGIAFILISVWTVPIVGVLRFALLSIAGQLSGALLLDVLAPTDGSVIGWNLLAGVLLAFVAVAVSAVRPGARRV